MMKYFLLPLLFQLVFHQQYFSKFLFETLNLSRSLLKGEEIAKVQVLLHATLLKSLILLPEEFQCNISAEI